MIRFDNWTIQADGEILARQFDNLTRTLTVAGDIPAGWEWAVLVQVGNAMDIIPLAATEGALSAVLTAQQLSVGDKYYNMQLRATQGDKVQHTNIVNVYIPDSLSGDEQWPTVPSEFSDMERRINEKAEQVEGYSIHPPTVGENGNWWEWDGEAYVDTGKPSRGERGVQGEQGEQGNRGEKGEKGDPGVVKFVVVNELPEQDTENAIYLVPVAGGVEDNLFDEYIFVDGAWEKIGSTSVAVNLDEYVKKTDYATEQSSGVVKVDNRYATRLVNGILDICAANNGIIDTRTPKENSLFSAGVVYRHTIVPSNVDYAVKKVLSDCKLEWTDEEKTAARDLLGVTEQIGNIETALDGIIAIQNSLIGGDSV